MENLNLENNIDNNLYIDYFDQYLQDFLQSVGYYWDKTYINTDGNFVKAIDTLGQDDNFFNGELKAVFLTDIDKNKQKVEFLKVTEYSLAFYNFVEDPTKVNKLDQFEVSVDFTQQFQYFMLKKYKQTYLDYIERDYYDCKDLYEDSRPNRYSKGKDQKAYNKMLYLKKLLDNLQIQLTDIIEDEKMYESLDEQSIESLDQILDPETLAMLYPEKELQDQEEFIDDGYSFEEYDDELDK